MSESTEYKTNLTRREVLIGASAVLAATTAPNVFAMGDEHNHGNHMAKHRKLVESALHCMRDGEACMDHCLGLFKQGDISVADCAASVAEMLAMCSALQKMASHDSRHIGELANVCLKVCKDCEKQCKKHAKKHESCAACARSCQDCIKECKRVAA